LPTISIAISYFILLTCLLNTRERERDSRSASNCETQQHKQIQKKEIQLCTLRPETIQHSTELNRSMLLYMCNEMDHQQRDSISYTHSYNCHKRYSI